MRARLAAVTATVTVVAAIAAAGCGTPSPAGRSASGRLEVVAAENVWGSLAAQLGGDRVRVTSVIDNPATDPHDYEPTPADARAVATAAYVVYNGAGYDAWMPKLLGASGRPHRPVLDVGALVGVKAGGNPHRWYAPDDVFRVIDRITADYERLAPADAGYFEQQRRAFVAAGLGEYRSIVAAIKARYGGTPIGASESVVVPLAQALGLQLVTPESLLDAVSEGADPTPGDKSRSDSQIRGRQIKVFVYNRQNTTPDVLAQIREAARSGIPTVGVTETLAPAGAAFQDWQVAQLRTLETALMQAVGR